MRYLIFLLLTARCFAGNWYINKTAAGTNAGTNWTNAWTEFNQINYSSVACGDTIWVAGGNYVTAVTSTKVCTSGSRLTVQRVLATDAVPVASPGWSAGFDSTVNNAGTVCDLEGDYTTISGRIPAGWVGTTPVGGGNSCVGALTRSITGDTIDHIKFPGPACAAAGNCTVGSYGINIVPATNTVTGLTVQYCELFDMSEPFRQENWQNSVVQYNSIHDMFNDGIDHEDVVYNYHLGPLGNVIWRYNTIYNSPNDGVFFEFGGADHFYFYRNVFYASTFSLMTVKGPGTYGPIFLYNNIFAAPAGSGPCSSNCSFLYDTGNPIDITLYNNVFYYVTNSIGGTSDYNAYSYTTQNGSSWPSSELHSFTYNPGTQNPFVNMTTGNFHLTSLATVLNGLGKTLDTDGFINVDMDGNVAGAAWNVGAFNNPPNTHVGVANSSWSGSVVVK